MRTSPPPPDFSPEKYFADPNNPPAGLQNVTALFWQIGFGNRILNSGLGSSGTGNSGPSTFNGNDQGLFVPDLAEARSVTGNTSIPAGAFCLRSNNWGNTGVDGCCDNDRGTTLSPNNDDILNPYYDVYYARNGYPGLYSLDWQQDYPIAVLLKESSGQYFAFAAVATMSRGNTGGGADGPCAAVPGTNPAPCDFRMGSYPFNAISNGLPNAAAPGSNNVIPWQETPQPEITSDVPADPNDPNSDRIVDVQWPAVTIYSDQSVRPTTHPQMGGANGDPNQFAAGVGVNDIAAKFPLLRYIIQVAPDTDPNFSAPSASIETTSTSLSGMTVPFGSCLRLRTLFGKKPQTTTKTTANCRLGRCGDVGYEVSSERACLESRLAFSPPPGGSGGSGEPGSEPPASPSQDPSSGSGRMLPIVDPDIAAEIASQGMATVSILLRGAHPIQERPSAAQERAFLEEVTASREAVRPRLPRRGLRVIYEYRYVFGFIAEIDGRGLLGLAASSEVERVNLTRPLRPLVAEGVPLIGASTVHFCGNTGGNPPGASGIPPLPGRDIGIAIIDTGIDWRHDAFGGCFGFDPNSSCTVAAGADCAPSGCGQIFECRDRGCCTDEDCKLRTGCTDLGCCVDPVCTESANGESILDRLGHGTAVAGIAAARPLGGSSLLGVAPDAKLVAVQWLDSDPVLGALGGTAKNVEISLDWVIGNRDRFNVKLVNMSLGAEFPSPDGPCPGTATATFIQDLVNVGVAVVAASGNTGREDGVSFPACAPGAIAVGGVYDANLGNVSWGCDPNGQNCICTDLDTHADMYMCNTTSGRELDVLAPSWQATTAALTSPGNTAPVMQFAGTSASAPYVAGALALMFFSDPNQNEPVAALESRLKATGTSVTNPHNSKSYPRINVRRAIQLDRDFDGFPDAYDTCLQNPVDNFLSDYNPSQVDTDHDGEGDVCDPDDDNDGVPDGIDNCRAVYNPTQADADGDGIGDACDVCQDADHDGICEPPDNCPSLYNPAQADGDGDAAGDACDCAPQDNSAFAIPVTVEILSVEDISGGYRFSWNSQASTAGTGTAYDIFTGNVLALRPSGNFSTGTCREENRATTTYDYIAPEPPIGDAHYLMLRGQNACPNGTGTYGNVNRDTKAAASAHPCS